MDTQLAKRCAKCRAGRPATDYYAYPRNKDGLTSWCRFCMAASARDWAKKNPEKRRTKSRRWFLDKKYGITQEQYDAMLTAQDGKCAICREEGKTTVPHQRFALHVDHDHDTGRVRGLLCHRCNSLLGQARDSEKVLRAAIAYLKKKGPVFL